MPLGQREGDTSDNRLCGVETEFSNAMPFVINFNITFGGFDFIVAPLRNPGYRPTIGKPQFGSFEVRTVSPFAGSDFAVSAQQWNSCVVGKISSWIDLDSKDKTLRKESEVVLKEEIARASYLSLQACLLPAPKGTSCVNYARCVYQILPGLRDMQLWLRIPLNPDDDSSASSGTLVDSWEIWNSFRLLCEHHSSLKIALDNLGPLPSDNSLERWFGEPVIIAIMHTDDFSTKDRDNTKYLSRRMHKLVTDFFNHSMQIVISGNLVHPEAIGDSLDSHSAADSQKHPLRPYLDYVGSVYKRLDPLPEQECLEFGLRDVLQIPLHPIKKNLKAKTYENFERDVAKSIQYEKAICQALLDRVPDEKVSEITTVLMVVGAGRGTIVQASIQAAKETGRKLRVYAVEKNHHAIVALDVKGWVDIVTISIGDVRFWNAPEPADIMVSDLLGSFGDNELSPECLDGAKRILKKDGISIPSSYTSFLQPVTASKLYNGVKAHKDISHFETPYVVKMHNVTRLAPTQPVFTFTHPDFDKDRSCQHYKKLHFVMPNDAGSAMVHGFAGYFDATLYKDVHLGIRPSTATPNVFSWFPMFFPLRKPICVDRGSTLEVHFWRHHSLKVWYEWCVTSPSISPIHNNCGRSYAQRL